MNQVFIKGKIQDKVEYKFIVNGKNTAIAIFVLEIASKKRLKQKVIIKGYNEIADFCFRNLKKGENVVINGNLNSYMEIEIIEIVII